jgi:hypothetical protein
LHYLYEVHYFSDSLTSSPEEEIGILAVKIIKGKAVGMSFLTDGNSHDETLYWRKAMRHIETLVPQDDWEFFKETQDKIIKIADSMISGHFVDLLWNLNSIYPNLECSYHLQQEIWLLLEEELSEMSTKDFETLITQSLTLDNRSFLEQVLKK